MVADDHRFDAVGCNGDATVKTPHLDALARGGTNFRRAYMMGGLSGAVCIPARAMLHTGRGTFHTSAGNAVDNTGPLMTLKKENPTLGQVVGGAGYHTHAVGKWHNDKASFNRSFRDGNALFFGGMHSQWHSPIQAYDPAGEYKNPTLTSGAQHATDVYCDAAIDFLNHYRSAQPFFLYVAFTSPHDPRTAPTPYHEMYAPEAMPVPPNFMAQHPFDNGDLLLRDEQLADFPRTPQEIQRHTADYYAMISHMDTRIGDVLQTMEARGHAENTIVVYTSDHGLSVGRHGLMGKQNLYEHSVRVPLLLRGPGVPSGREANALCYSFDLFPTLCEMAGAKIPRGIDGQTLRPLLRGETKQHRSHVGAVYKDIQRMWSDGEWKVIRYTKGRNGAGEARVQLFHIAADPHEMHDLAADPAHAFRLRMMLQNLRDWQKANGDFLN